MADIIHTDPKVQAQVIDLVTRERENSLSNREWRHRLAGYGYGIRSTETGQFIERLSTRAAICAVPAHLCV